MKALLLAAGLGTRLRPLTDTIPKCLVPIAGRPLLGYWFDLLFPDFVEMAVVNTHHLSDQVEGFVAASPWADRLVLAHEPELLGTGGTILANRSHFEDEAFLVIHADNLSIFDVGAFIEAHRRRPRQALITMMTFATDRPQECGIVEMDDEELVRAFHEKIENPPGTRANAAVYIMEPEVISFLDGLDKTVIDLSTEVLPYFLGRMATFHNGLYHRDIGTPESLARAQRDVGDPTLFRSIRTTPDK